MSVMAANLYEALISAGASKELAQKAAVEAAEHDTKFAKINADLLVLKWMASFTLAIQVAMMFKLYH
jgi:hypothetical protein